MDGLQEPDLANEDKSLLLTHVNHEYIAYINCMWQFYALEREKRLLLYAAHI